MEDTQEEEKEGWSEKWNDPLKGNPRLSLPSQTLARPNTSRSFGTQSIASRADCRILKNAQSAMKRQSDLNRPIFNNQHALNGIEDS